MLPPAMDDSQPVHCMIEIPKGSRNKYEWDAKLQAIKLNRFLFSSVVYPTDYGFVTGTLGESGDALYIIVSGRVSIQRAGWRWRPRRTSWRAPVHDRWTM